MLATSVRVRPCSERCGPRSVGRVTVTTPSSRLTVISRGIACSSDPLGPFTPTRPGPMSISTPAGRGMGALPIRLIAGLPDEAEHFAANAALCGLTACDHADGGGHDRGTEAAEHFRQAIGLGVDAATGLRDALDALDDASTVVSVLQRDREHVERLLAARNGEGLDVALVQEQAGDLDLELGAGHGHRLVPRQVGVADAGQHVGDWIGQHRGLPARLRHARDDALMRELAQADAAYAELPEDRARPSTAIAARVVAHLVAVRLRGLDSQRRLRHVTPP